MGKIICLMGKSSSGKDTIYKQLRTIMPQLMPIVLYTTRPKREGEREGVEYHFVDEARYLALKEAKQIVEERAYNTCLGLWRYFTVWDDEKDLSKESYVMIGTLEAYEKIRDFVGENKVLPVLIELDDGVRLQRALDREKTQDPPKYMEMCRRFLADADDFSEEKIAKAGISRSFYNNNLSECLSEIEKYILEEIG